MVNGNHTIRRQGLTLCRRREEARHGIVYTYLSFQLGATIACLPTSLTVLGETARGAITPMDFVMTEKEVFPPESNVTDMTNMVHVPGMVLAMSVQRLLSSI